MESADPHPHSPKFYSSVEAFASDLAKISDLVYSATGIRTYLYRFPGGSGNKVSKIKIKDCVKILKKEYRVGILLTKRKN